MSAINKVPDQVLKTLVLPCLSGKELALSVLKLNKKWKNLVESGDPRLARILGSRVEPNDPLVARILQSKIEALLQSKLEAEDRLATYLGAYQVRGSIH